jgi:hypothetical protein
MLRKRWFPTGLTWKSALACTMSPLTGDVPTAGPSVTHSVTCACFASKLRTRKNRREPRAVRLDA